MKQVLIVLGAFLIAAVLVMAFITEAHQQELIDSGQCRVTDTRTIAGYTTYSKVGDIQVPQYHPPREQKRWVCEEESFWRNK